MGLPSLSLFLAMFLGFVSVCIQKELFKPLMEFEVQVFFKIIFFYYVDKSWLLLVVILYIYIYVYSKLKFM